MTEPSPFESYVARANLVHGVRMGLWHLLGREKANGFADNLGAALHRSACGLPFAPEPYMRRAP